LKAKTPQKEILVVLSSRKVGKNKDFVVVYIACICNWLRTYFLIVADFYSYCRRLYCWCLASHDASAIRYLFVAFYGDFMAQ